MSIYKCREHEVAVLIQAEERVGLACPLCGENLVGEEGHLVHLTVSALPETDTPKELLLRKTTSTTLSVGN